MLAAATPTVTACIAYGCRYAEARCPDYLFLPTSRLPTATELAALALRSRVPASSPPAAPPPDATPPDATPAVAPPAADAPPADAPPAAIAPPDMNALAAFTCPRSTEPPLTPHACALACLPAAAAGCVPPPLQPLFAADGPLGGYFEAERCVEVT